MNVLNPKVDTYFQVGCGRCPLGGTPEWLRASFFGGQAIRDTRGTHRKMRAVNIGVQGDARLSRGL